MNFIFSLSLYLFLENLEFWLLIKTLILYFSYNKHLSGKKNIYLNFFVIIHNIHYRLISLFLSYS